MTRNGIRYPDVIDLVAMDAEGTPILIVVETEPLAADDAPALQQKLNNYLSYALDGQLVANYPQATGKPVRIRVDLYALPDEFIQEFFLRYAAACEQERMTLEVNIKDLDVDL
jgi:hypothetical protein